MAYCEQVQTSQPWSSNEHWTRSSGHVPLAGRAGQLDVDGGTVYGAGAGPLNEVLVDSMTGCFGMLSKVPLVMHPAHAEAANAASNQAESADPRRLGFIAGMTRW